MRLHLGRIGPPRGLFPRHTRKTSITSPGKSFTNYVNRTCNTSSPLLQTLYIGPPKSILSPCSIIYRKMSDQSNVPQNPEDLKCGNLFDVEGFGAVVTGVSSCNTALT